MNPRRGAPRSCSASTHDADAVLHSLHRAPELVHLRTRRRGPLVIIESGPQDDPFPHARLRRVGPSLWQLEMPTMSGRWQTTPLRAPRDELVAELLSSFGWTLAQVV